MRRFAITSSLTGLISMSLVALITACATAPVDDGYAGLTQDQTPAAPEENNSAKLQPPSNPAKEQPPAEDAGAPKDSGTPIKQDSGSPPPPVDSGPPPPTSGADCDPNDPMYYFAFILATQSGTPPACPCATGQCCYIGMACLPQ